MSDRHHTRLMIAAVTLGLFMAMYACCPMQPAHAEPKFLQPGAQCLAEPVKVESVVVTRDSFVRAIATAKSEQRCTGLLGECTRRVVRVSKPEAQWKVAARWIGVGIGMGVSFWLGVRIGEAL